MRKWTIALALAFGLFGIAQGWQPYRFKGNEQYTYRVASSEQVFTYTLELRRTERTNAAGEEIFGVRYTTELELPASEIEAGTAFGIGTFGTVLQFAAINPFFLPFFQQLELVEGEKMSLMGAGLLKVTGRKTVAGRTGYVVELYQGAGDQATLQARWVIDPALALPLKSETFNEAGEPEFVMELVEYRTF